MAASLKNQIQDLMTKLNPGSVIGLDIGAHSIKVCEISGGPGKFKIERFGVFTLSEAVLIEDEIQKPSEIIEGVQQALADAGIKSKTLCLGLFGPNTMTKRLNVPEGSREEIEDHILWEAEQYITFGADDSAIDFYVIGDNEGGGKDALVAAVKNETVESFTEILQEAKFNVKIIDLNVIALSNVLEECLRKSSHDMDEGVLLLDFGAQSTKIIVFKRGGPIFTKEVPVGGGLITEEIQRQMGVSYEDAENLKTTTDENGNLPEEILNIINAQLDKHVAEVRKNINFYVTQGSAEKVDHCFITGGSSLLPGLIERLDAATELEVQRLDVLSAFKLGAKFRGDEDHLAAISPVVLGLAMRKIS